MSSVTFAHTIEGSDASFVQAIDGPAVFPFIYLGAKHMVTGYDHLLFLVGVIFFLYRPRHVVQYVTLFAVGHSITLLLGVLADIRINAFLIDAIIGLSIVYKAFENIDGFKRFLGFEPNTRIAVFVFGLFHGLGLATKLQEFTISDNGLVTNIISFNVGVEIGQILALSAVFIGLSIWRTHASYLRHAFVTNTALMTGGFLLAGYQFSAFVLQPPY
ncbi:MAG: HupE/UreJ family protein [Pseudohongiellaceae bacterium]